MKKGRQGRTSRTIAKRRTGPESVEVRQTPAVFAVITRLGTVTENLRTGTDARGHVSMRSAIMAANTQPGADTILLPDGMLNLTTAGGQDAAARGNLDIRV